MNQEKLEAILILHIFTQNQLCSIVKPPVLLPILYLLVLLGNFMLKNEGERVLLKLNLQKKL